MLRKQPSQLLFRSSFAQWWSSLELTLEPATKKMPCSKEEALVRLFYNASSSFQLLFIFLISLSILLLKFLNFIGSYPLIQRSFLFFCHSLPPTQLDCIESFFRSKLSVSEHVSQQIISGIFLFSQKLSQKTFDHKLF